MIERKLANFTGPLISNKLLNDFVSSTIISLIAISKQKKQNIKLPFLKHIRNKNMKEKLVCTQAFQMNSIESYLSDIIRFTL